MILSFLVSNFLSYSGNLNRGKRYAKVWYSHYCSTSCYKKMYCSDWMHCIWPMSDRTYKMQAVNSGVDKTRTGPDRRTGLNAQETTPTDRVQKSRHPQPHGDVVWRCRPFPQSSKNWERVGNARLMETHELQSKNGPSFFKVCSWLYVYTYT